MKKLKLELQKPVAFYPQLAEVLGGIEEALYFQQLYYWSDKGEREDDFIYKSKKEIEEETTLSRYQQDRIRKKFKEKDILETKKKKVNGAPTLHYKVKPGIVRNLLMESRETNDSNRKKLTNPTYTENTTENGSDEQTNPPKRNNIKYPKEDYDKVTESYKDIKGVEPKGTEWEPIQQEIKTMFMNERTPEQIISFMRDLEESDEEWTQNWTIRTVKMKMHEYLAGNLELKGRNKSKGWKTKS